MAIGVIVSEWVGINAFKSICTFGMHFEILDTKVGIERRVALVIWTVGFFNLWLVAVSTITYGTVGEFEILSLYPAVRIVHFFFRNIRERTM
jgi:hypothetical protein